MKTYTIKEVAALFGLPSSTLRYYEELGLLPEVERTEMKQRVYTQAHIARLNGIECFKRTGLSLKQIGKFFEYEADLPVYIEDILELVVTHEADIQEEIHKLQQDLEHIQHKVRYYRGIREALQRNEEWPCWEAFEEEE